MYAIGTPPKLATFSLGRRQQIGNQEDSVSSTSFWQLRIRQFSLWALRELLTEHKWSTRNDFERNPGITPAPRLFAPWRTGNSILRSQRPCHASFRVACGAHGN